MNNKIIKLLNKCILMDSTEAKAWGTWCSSGQQATATDMLVHSEATTILGDRQLL